MADRRTKIILSLDSGPYKRGLASAAAATKAFTRELDTSNERMSWLVQSSLALGPALVPIGASLVPAVTALSSGLAAAAGAAGAAVLAFQGVGDGVKALNDYALEPSADNLEKVRTALAELAPAGQEFVLFLDELRPKMDKLQATAQTGLFPGVMDGIDALMTRAPQVNRIIYELSDTMGDLTREAGQGLASDRWSDFFDYIEREARPILSDFGRSMGNFTEGIANMLIAFDPLSDQFSGGMLKISRSFARWTRELDDNQSFQGFVDYVRRVGPDVVDTFGTLVVALSDIVKAAAPIGEYSLPIIEALARALAAVAESPAGPALIGTAAAVSALSRAIALSNVAGTTALVGALRSARTEGGRLGKTADKLAGTFSKGGALAGGVGILALSFTDLDEKIGLSNTAMGAMLGSVAGPWGAAIGGGIGLAKDFAASNNDVESAMKAVDEAAKTNNVELQLKRQADALGEVKRRRAELDDASLGSIFNPDRVFGRIHETFTDDLAEAKEEAIDARTETVSLLNKASSLYVQARGKGPMWLTTDIGEMKRRFKELEPILNDAGIELENLYPNTPEWDRAARAVATYNKRMDGVPARSAEVRQAIKELDNPMLNAADSADKLEAALNGLFSPALDAEEALLKYKQGVVDLRKQLIKTNGTLNVNTKAGRDNRQAIVDHVNATMELATAQARQDGNSKRAIRTLKDARKAVVDAGRAAGMSEEEIRDYLKQLNFTRGVWKARIETPGLGEAVKDVSNFHRELFGLPDKHDTKVNTPGSKKSRDEVSGLARLLSTTPNKHDTKFNTPGLGVAIRDVGNFHRDLFGLPNKHDTKVDAPGVEKATNQVGNFFDAITKTPDKKNVNTKAPGAKEAAGDVDQLRKNMSNLRNRKVTMTVTSKTEGIINQIQKFFDNINPFNADGRIWDFYAGGGIRENHIAQIAPAGSMRVWAEPETGGEAYIPFAASKRKRSRQIADETVDRLGGHVMWNRDGALYSPNTVTAPASVAPDPMVGFQQIADQYATIATEFGKGLGDAVEYALSNISTGFSWPLPRQYQPSGTWGHYASGGSHPALDFPAPNGTPIYPVFPGRVMHTTSLGSSYGNYTEVQHGNGLSSLYAHQQAFRTTPGATVMPGQTIGLVDSTGNSTGPHLHLEVKRNGTSFDYTSMLNNAGSMGIFGLPGQYHGDHSGLDRASPSTAQAYAQSVMGRWGWSQFHWPYWQDLGHRESGWRWDARNPSSGAYGIPQSLPPEKLAASGPDWRTNAGTQIDWMGNYIAERYGSPYKAIGFHNANNWYGDGGILDRVGGYARGGMLYPGQFSYNELRKPERILDPRQTALFEKLVVTLGEVARRPGGVAAGARRTPNLIQPFTATTGRPRRRRRRDDSIDTPDLTRKSQRELMRAERQLQNVVTVIARREEAAKRARRRVNEAEKALDKAKGKREKREAKAALDDAKSTLKVANKRTKDAERRRKEADRDIERAERRVQAAREDQKILDRAVRQFDLRGGMGRADVRAEFNELIKGVRQSMGKDSALFKALKRMGKRATEVGKRLDDERKLRDKLNDRLRNLQDAARQYRTTVRQNFRNDPFSGGLDEFSLQVRADRNDAKSMRRALARARKRGLSGGLYKQLAASGNLELAQQFANLSRAQITRYERLFEQRQKTSAALAEKAADAVYGKRLDKANRLVERQNMIIERLRLRLERFEDRVGNRIERGARRGVRDGMNGRKKKLHQFVLEARS